MMSRLRLPQATWDRILWTCFATVGGFLCGAVTFLVTDIAWLAIVVAAFWAARSVPLGE